MNASFLELLFDARRARRQDPAWLGQRQTSRLGAVVAFARAHSPFYREHYHGLPERIDRSEVLPITNKKQLMERFNDWVTDREVTLDGIRAFIGDPERLGKRFLNRYTAATTSGTTGTRGIFLIDDQSMAVTKALALRMLGD